MRGFGPLYLASLREFMRDTSALFWTLAFPVMFIIIFGIIFTNDGDIEFDVGLVNEDGTASQIMVDGFQQVEAFQLHQGSRDAELDALAEGERAAVIIIPAGTGAQIEASFTELTGAAARANPAQLEVYYDAADQSSSQIVLDVIDKVVAGMNAGITGVPPVVAVDARRMAADDMRSIDYLLPGVLAMSLMQLGLFGTAGPLVALREKQVLRRMGATPLSKTTMLGTQVALRLTTAFVQTGVIVVVGSLLFNVRIEWANLPAILGVVALGATMFIIMGYFISGLAKTEEAVQGIISLPNFIFMFLSGIFFPVEMMPDWIRPLVDVIPLTYLGDALRHTMIEAGYEFSMLTNVVVLGVWLVVCAVLAVRFFRWEPQA